MALRHFVVYPGSVARDEPHPQGLTNAPMPHIDQVVLALLLLGLIGSAVDHWRRGQRGWRLAGIVFVSLYGVGLVAMLAAHCVDILYNLILANRSVVDGSQFRYNWRTYSLLLFGVLIIERGARVLWATRRFAVGDSRARAEILRNAGIVLAITLPTIPIHAFFGVLISVWTSLALLVTALGLRFKGSELLKSDASDFNNSDPLIQSAQRL